MFGKAVQIRHCPATVSASAGPLVVLEGSVGIRPDATGRDAPGKAARESASQETGPWVPLTCLRSEGDGGYRCLFGLVSPARALFFPASA